MSNAESVYADFNISGVAASGRKRPKKSEVRALLASYETQLAQLAMSGLLFSTRASLFSSLGYPANTMAWVNNDSTAAYNGIYLKSGGSGSGSWSRSGDLPYSFIRASDAGAGTGNAIQATTAVPVSESALITLNIFQINPGSPVTVSFNGGPPVTIKTNSGQDIAPGGLAAGMIVTGFLTGGTLRLINDQVASAIVAQAEAAAAQALAVVGGLGSLAAAVDDAQSSSLAAATARDQAQAARDAAFANANVYASESAGRAAVSNGVQFQVVVNNEIIRYQRIDASTSTEVARYPSSDFIRSRGLVSGEYRSDDLMVFLDADDQIFGRVDQDGAWELLLSRLATAAGLEVFEYERNGGYPDEIIIADADLSIVWAPSKIQSGGGFAPAHTTSAVTARAGDFLLADTTAGSFAITLPASPAQGDALKIIGAGWGINNLTIMRNGSLINGDGEDLLCTFDDEITFIFSGGTWVY